MAVKYDQHYSTKKSVDQFTVIPGREADMVDNHTGTGAKVFKVSKWTQFERFLLLGTEGGSFYVGEHELTKENATNTIDVIRLDGPRAVKMIVEISDAGRAHKNDPALYALAIAASADDLATRQAALEALPKVARIGTHLFHFAQYVEGFRGWGKALRRAVANWYLEKPTDKLVYQLIKYQQRDGWSHRDLLRLAHPKSTDVNQNAALRWTAHGFDALDTPTKLALHEQIAAFETLRKTTDENTIIDLIREYKLPREALASEQLTANVWAALLEDMPLTATIRSLGVLSKQGIIDRNSVGEQKVLSLLRNETALKSARIHPISVLAAMKTYGSGRGVRGTNSWDVNSKIIDALDEAFYKTFDFVEPTGKRIMMALDVSGSMGSAMVSGIPNLTAREAVGAMAMVTARVEEGAEFFGFRRTLSRLNISPRQRLDDVMKAIAFSDFGSTDCAAPMNWAYDNKERFDAFTVWTDNDTGTGSYYTGKSPQASQRLVEYRKQMQVDAKLVVCATQAYNYSIADPQDSGQMDVIGFDTSVPTIISDFIRN